MSADHDMNDLSHLLRALEELEKHSKLPSAVRQTVTEHQVREMLRYAGGMERDLTAKMAERFVRAERERDLAQETLVERDAKIESLEKALTQAKNDQRAERQAHRARLEKDAEAAAALQERLRAEVEATRSP